MEISNSLVERTSKIVEANPTMDILDAFKQALLEEQAFMAELIDQKTPRAIKAKQTVMETTYFANKAIKW